MPGQISKRWHLTAPNGVIPIAICISATLHILAGGSVDDIGLSHGLDPGYIYQGAVWPVIDAVRSCPDLHIGYITNQAYQKKIANCFKTEEPSWI